jgi:DNA-binding CsgD family transcriptional regulator
MEALLLKSQGIAHKKIADLTGICPNTLRTYLRDYQAGGINLYLKFNLQAN